MDIKYRPDIDGLRAIAVIFVILFHSQITVFGIQFFRGGYIGVDIFFVISGYLITSILLKELYLKKKINFNYFYQRRIRRLIPALLAVMIFSTLIASIYLPPSRFVEFSKSILYSLGFSSNFYFYFSELNYFEFEGLFLPFLHTWSLSVEEQYYILFPILLFIFFNYSKKNLFIFLIFSFLISFFLAEYGSRNLQNSTFYFLHSRMWELLAGSILAYLKINISKRNSIKLIHNYIPSIGLLMIFLSLLLFYDEKIRHPSFFTLLPVIGTCLIIWFGEEKNDIVSKLLSTKLFVGIGLISYSLYIWHFPIFSFAKISGLVSGNIILKILLILFTFAISGLSYYFIERKFRNKDIQFKNLFLIVVTISIIIIFINLHIINNQGFPNRYDNSKSVNKNYNVDNFALSEKSVPKENRDKQEFNPSKIKILIIGDSHGDDFHNIFFSNKNLFSNYDFIKAQNNRFNLLTKSKIINSTDTIIFSYRWTEEDFDFVFKKMVPYLKNKNKKIVITSNTNEYRVKSKMYTLLDNEILFKKNTTNYFKLKKLYYENRVLNSNASINKKLKKLAKKYDLVYLNKEDYLCDLVKKECDYVTDEGHKIFYDYGHHTLEGAKYLGKKIFQMGWLKVN
tara:strand:+ start:1783 stop:3651 length:1869 start_codon:yes stop_codon:yes gene_type:complete